MRRPGGSVGRDDGAGAGVVGAVLLFGIFVAFLAILNVTAVPQQGLEDEARHHERVLDGLGGLQSAAEATGVPGAPGASVAALVPLGPEGSPAGGFMRYFLAEPARAAGELSFNASYGNVTLTHVVAGESVPVEDVGTAADRFPMGRVLFDPHPVFREPGVVSAENGAVVTTQPLAETVRFAPPVSVAVNGTATVVNVHVNVLNGTLQTVGGTSNVRLRLEHVATTRTSASAANAEEATLRIETAHGEAWGAHLNATAEGAGLSAGSGFVTTVEAGAGVDGLDVVTWRVLGVGSGNDVRLSYGMSIHNVRMA